MTKEKQKIDVVFVGPNKKSTQRITITPFDPKQKISVSIIDQLRNITREQKWKHESVSLLKENSFSLEFITAIHTTWIESGHHIRSQIGNDTLLVKLLRHILPNYNGGDLVLYRGENFDRWKENSIGLCWTKSIDVARMFGRGLNSVHHGGLLLTCNCKADWIISGPNAHSGNLGESEYTVDPLKISDFKVLERYNPI